MASPPTTPFASFVMPDQAGFHRQLSPSSPAGCPPTMPFTGFVLPDQAGFGRQFSQTSTAFSTPNAGFHLPDLFTDSSSEEESWPMLEPDQKMADLVCRGPAPTISSLEEKLEEVKGMYMLKYGRDVDEEDEKGQSYEFDEEGTLWIKTVGRGPAPTISSLEEKLEEVKEMYKEKYGRDVDDEDEKGQSYEFDEEGTLWIKTVGRGPAPTVSSLEAKLEEVKGMYKEKYGRDVDDEDEKGQCYEYDEEGTLWIKTVGRGPAPTLSSLEEKLEEVKGMYKEKYGRDVDEEDEKGQSYEYDEEGTLWIKTVGRGPAPTLSALEEKLVEVKVMFKEQTGQDVDSEDEDEEEPEHEYEYDEEGTPWIQTVGRGTPPQVRELEWKLAEVKFLFKQRYGEAVDSDCEEEGQHEEGEYDYDEDGMPWIVTTGVSRQSSDLVV